MPINAYFWAIFSLLRCQKLMAPKPFPAIEDLIITYKTQVVGKMGTLKIKDGLLYKEVSAGVDVPVIIDGKKVIMQKLDF